MSENAPFTWNPSEVITMTNTSSENILLELDSGPLRLDAGRTLRLTSSAMEQPQVMRLIREGKVTAEKERNAGRPMPTYNMRRSSPVASSLVAAWTCIRLMRVGIRLADTRPFRLTWQLSMAASDVGSENS